MSKIKLNDEKISIEKVLNFYKIEYEYKNNQIWFPCVFHKETLSSLNFSIENKIFNCFGCHKHGTILTFIKEYDTSCENNYDKAIKKLCYICGIDVTELDFDEMLELTTISIKEYNEKELVIYNEKSINKYYRVVNRSFYIAKQFKKETLDEFEMGFSTERRDRYYNRNVFPIRDIFGDLVGLSARTIIKEEEKKAKWMHSKNFDKKMILYNLNNALKYIEQKNEVIIVESIGNCMRMYEHGYKNVAAILGNTISKYQYELIKNYKIKLLLDEDGGGFLGINYFLKDIWDGKTNIYIGDMSHFKHKQDISDILDKSIIDKIEYTKITDYFIKNILKGVQQFKMDEFERDVDIVTIDGYTLTCTNNIKPGKKCITPKDVKKINTLEKFFGIDDFYINK